MKNGNSGKALFFLLSFVSLQLFALDVKQDGRKIHVATKTLNAVIENAAVTHLADHSGKIIISDSKLNELSGTSGLGNMKGMPNVLSKYHRKHGEENILPPHSLEKVPLYRRPDHRSILTVEKTGAEYIVSWKGLSNGGKYYPEDMIQLKLRERADGTLGIRGTAVSKENGVFGLQIPLENIRKECNFVLPAFGGMFYRGDSPKRGLMTFMMDQMYYDAPVMTVECGSHAAGFWSEDPTFRQLFAFFRRGERSNAFALELMNPMPFEAHRKISQPELLLNVFPDSGWIGAAAPYRNWYQKQFAKEIAIRDGSGSDRINMIVCTRGGSLKQNLSYYDWKKMQKNFGGKMFFGFWHLRNEGFDRELPDYTLHPDTVESVQFLQKHNIKTSGYFNPICVNYNSRKFKADKLNSFVLTRINTVDNYNAGKAGDISIYLGGTVDAGTAQNRFSGIPDGRILYLDPLSKKWRNYIINIGENFKNETGLDYLYVDCLGVVNDPGNGLVDGKTGAEGIADMAKELLNRCKVSFMTEYGAAPIAFASKWPFVSSGRHVNIKPFFLHRLHNQRPMSAFLFGYRPFGYELTQTKNEAQYHLAEAVADATSGVGFARSDSCEIFSGFKNHLFIRAKVFTDNELQPYYPPRKYPENILAMYKDSKGRIFRYYDDGKLQMMLNPDGKALYGRLNGASSFSNPDLGISKWPLRNGATSFGLDPEKHYALYPCAPGLEKSSVNVPKTSVPVRLKYYYETPHYAYLELNPVKEKTANITFQPDQKYKKVYINGIWMEISEKKFTVKATLPVRCIFSDGKEVPADTFRFVSDTSGLEEEKSIPIGKPKRIFFNKKFYLTKPAQSVLLDGLYDVKSGNDAIDFYTQNIQYGSRISDASVVTVLINGIPVKSYDAAPKKNPVANYRNRLKRYMFDYNLYHWRIPLGKYAGDKVLITIKIDSKGYEHDDMQIVSVPQFVQDPAQKLTEERISRHLPKEAFKYFTPEK
ncbi:MAG: hypothetical protein IKB25_06810 [Lentisphaeria bacterium]|nr:hypothetical protein [Lentisphaeria bacterium]